MIQPEHVHDIGGGSSQRLYRFENGLGASVLPGTHPWLTLSPTVYTGTGVWDFYLLAGAPLMTEVIFIADEPRLDQALERIAGIPPVIAEVLCKSIKETEGK